MVKNCELVNEILSEIICLVYKKDLLRNYLYKHSYSAISINIIKNYFNCERNLSEKYMLFDYIISFNHNKNEQSVIENDENNFRSLVTYYASIHKLNLNKHDILHILNISKICKHLDLINDKNDKAMCEEFYNNGYIIVDLNISDSAIKN